jgi:mono/diheme cytochrome c family protein
MRILAALVVLALIAAGALWLVSEPSPLDPAIAAAMDKPGDAKAGEIVFWTGGCSSCHAKPGAPLALGGGAELKTPFGPIHAPNISPDPEDGIGKWTPQDFAHAIYDGVDDEGAHLYPVFPYPSYRHMAVADVRDLWAYLRSLAPVKGEAPPPGFGFPFDIRRAVGLWKRLYLAPAAPPQSIAATDTAAYGRYLVEGAGHCGECHTPRDFLGGPEPGKALTGAPMPDGKGKAPNITPAGLSKWDEGDIEIALTMGITPDGDSLGDAMAEVVRNLSHLPKGHITAIARYLKAGGQ